MKSAPPTPKALAEPLPRSITVPLTFAEQKIGFLQIDDTTLLYQAVGDMLTTDVAGVLPTTLSPAQRDEVIRKRCAGILRTLGDSDWLMALVKDAALAGWRGLSLQEADCWRVLERLGPMSLMSRPIMQCVQSAFREGDAPEIARLVKLLKKSHVRRGAKPQVDPNLIRDRFRRNREALKPWHAELRSARRRHRTADEVWRDLKRRDPALARGISAAKLKNDYFTISPAPLENFATELTYHEEVDWARSIGRRPPGRGTVARYCGTHREQGIRNPRR